MPKLKTSRSVKKRIRISKRRKIKHFKAGRSHLLTSKRSKRKRHMGRPGFITSGEKKAIYRLLPYGA